MFHSTQEQGQIGDDLTFHTYLMYIPTMCPGQALDPSYDPEQDKSAQWMNEVQEVQVQCFFSHICGYAD